MDAKRVTLTLLSCAGASRRSFSVAVLLAAALSTPVYVHAEGGRPSAKRDAARGQPRERLSIEGLAARLKDAESTADDQLADKADVVALYEEALADLKVADEHAANAAKFAKQRIAAPYQLEARKREAAMPKKPPPQPADSASVDELEKMLESAKEKLAETEKTVATLEEEPERRASRRVEIPDAIAAAQMQLDELAAYVEPKDGAPAALVEARTAARQAKQKALKAEIESLEKELQTYDATAAELLTLERDAAEATRTACEERVAALSEAVNQRRQSEADREACEAQSAAVAAEPALRTLAEENSALAERRQQLAELIQELSAEAEAVDSQLEEVRAEFERMKEKVKAGGLTEAVGQMLRKQRSEIAAVGAQRHALRKRQEEIAAAQYELFTLDEQLAELRSISRRAKELQAALPPGCVIGIDDLKTLLRTRRDYLDALLKDYNTYFASLVELDSKQRALVGEAEAYRSFIDERVLWIRSARRLSLADMGRSIETAVWVGHPDNWSAMAVGLAQDAVARPEMTLIAVGVCVCWIIVRPRLRRAIGSWGEQARGAHERGEVVLASALKTTAASVLAAAWPAAVWYVGWRLTHSGSAFGEALGHGLWLLATILAPLAVTREICQPRGLAEAQFGWPPDALRRIRFELTWLMAVGAPLVVVIGMLEAQDNDAWKGLVGRALFIAAQGALAVFMIRMLRAPRGGLYQLMTMNKRGWLAQMARPTFFGLVGLAVALAGLAAAGYYYTALQLAWRLQETVWLVLMLVVGHTLLARWLTALYRRLAVEGIPGGDEENAVDLAKVDMQTQRLLHSVGVLTLVVGLGCVWVDVLPAVRIFKDVTLWADVDGNAAVSLASLVEAGIVLIMTLVAANNLPGLIEIVLLQRMPMDTGLRYAMTTVIRYVIAIVGLIFAGGAIGIGWPKVQWLAAAITFGLGFGLQEIFANFVSGLIVLVERPIRVGDTVTIGDVNGVVTRIRMRATTITDGDRKELIVPNKEFITGRLVNWTLSDTIVRATVKIAIAYGSDTTQAERLLLKIAAETPNVLPDPGPKAVFVGFGTNSLEFELRVFVSSVDHLSPVRHRLNTAIERRFREAGIQMAFPPGAPPRLAEPQAVKADPAATDSRTKAA